MNSEIVVSIVGHGTCGKTTSARWLSVAHELCYRYSTSEFAKTIINLTGNKFENRLEWGRAIANFNNEDEGIKLYKLMLGENDILDGIRRIDELFKTKKWVEHNGKSFMSVWIDRKVPNDPSCEIKPKHCDFIVDNNGDLTDLFNNLNFLCMKMRR